MYALIVNSSSGSGRAASLFRQVEDRMVQNDMPYESLLSDSKDASIRFLKRLMNERTLSAIVVIGGDGTTGSVVKIASDYNIPLAILPAGSGNDAARAFKLTYDPHVFVQKLLDFSTQQVDLLNVNGKLGITIAAAGVDAEIGEKANHSFYKKWLNRIRLGAAAYPIAAVHTLSMFTPFEVSLSVDKNPYCWQRTWLIAIGNTPSYGGGLRVCPEASPIDGVMHITVAHSASRGSLLLRLFPKLLRGNPIHNPSISYLTGKEITIRTDRTILFILDGEPVHSPQFNIRLLRGGLQLVITND